MARDARVVEDLGRPVDAVSAPIDAVVDAATDATLDASADAVLPPVPPGPSLDLWRPTQGLSSVYILPSTRTLYLGNDIYGNITELAPQTGAVVRMDATTGDVLGGIGGIDGSVESILPDGEGGYDVAGAFTLVDGQPRAGYAHFHGDWTLDDAFAPTVALSYGRPYLHETLRVGREIWFYGAFDSAEGVPCDNTVAFSLDTGLPVPGGPGFGLSKFAQRATTDTTLYVGGGLDGPMMRIDRITGAALPFNAPLSADSDIQSLWVAGDVLVVSGPNLKDAGPTRTRLMKLDATTGARVPWPVSVSTLAGLTVRGIVGDTILLHGVDGIITRINGRAWNHRRARIHLGTGLPLPNAPDWDDAIFTPVFIDGGVWYGSRSRPTEGPQGTIRERLTAIDEASQAVLPEFSALFGSVNPALREGNTFIASTGGGAAGGVRRWGLGALDLDTGRPRPLQVDFDYALDMSYVITPTRIVLRGRFDRIGGQPTGGLTEIDAVTGQNLGLSAPLRALAAQVGHPIFMAASRNRLYGACRERAEALDGHALALDLPAWVPAPGAPDLATATFAPDRDVGYRRIGLGADDHLEAVDEFTGEVLWETPVAGDYFWIFAEPERIWLFGRDITAAGQVRGNIACLDAQTGDLLPFAVPTFTIAVETLAVVAGKVFAAGRALDDPSGGGDSAFLAVDADTGEVRPVGHTFGAFSGRWIRKLETFEGVLYVSGRFTSVDGRANSGLFAFRPEP